MAKKAVVERGMPIKLACQAAFSTSETCYRYEAKLSSENDEIADWLIRLTEINQVWSMDFMHDQLQDGRLFRMFNLIDEVVSSTKCNFD